MNQVGSAIVRNEFGFGRKDACAFKLRVETDDILSRLKHNLLLGKHFGSRAQVATLIDLSNQTQFTGNGIPFLTLASLVGKKVVLNIFPSIDTGTYGAGENWDNPGGDWHLHFRSAHPLGTRFHSRFTAFPSRPARHAPRA